MDQHKIACQVCLLKYHSVTDFLKHVKLKRHWQQMAVVFGNDVCKAPGRIPRIVVMDQVAKHPIVGLSLMTLCLSQSSIFYLCHVCEHKSWRKSIWGHLLSPDHYSNYYNYTDPDALSFSWISGMDMRRNLKTVAATEIKNGGSGPLQVLELPVHLFSAIEESSYSQVMRTLNENEKLFHLLKAGKPKRMTLQTYQRDTNRKHILLGLQHLVECVCLGQPEKRHYLCMLCHLTLASHKVIKHVLSFDHIFCYFNTWHPSTLLKKECYKSYTSFFSFMMLDFAKQTEEIHGTAITEIKQVTLEPAVFTSVESSCYAEALKKLESIRKEQKGSSLIMSITPGPSLVSHGAINSCRLRCQDCNLIFETVARYVTHMKQWEHKQMLTRIFGQDMVGDLKGSHHIPTIFLCNYLKQSRTEPVIGVPLIVMCVCTMAKVTPICVCFACKDSFLDIREHLNSAKHLIHTLVYQNPLRLPFAWETPLDVEALKSLAWAEEKDKGQHDMLLKIFDVPDRIFDRLYSPLYYSNVLETMEPFQHHLKREVPTSVQSVQPNFLLLGQQFLVMHNIGDNELSKQWGYLCLLCARTLPEDEFHCHAFSREHVTTFLERAHPGSLNEHIDQNTETLMDLAQQAAELHPVLPIQIMDLQKPIWEEYTYSQAVTVLTAVKKRAGRGKLFPMLTCGEKLVPTETLKEVDKIDTSQKNNSVMGTEKLQNCTDNCETTAQPVPVEKELDDGKETGIERSENRNDALTQMSGYICKENGRESPEKIRENPEKMSESPEKMSESPEKMSESPEKMSESPEKMSESPKKMSESPEKMSKSPEKMRVSPEKMRVSPEKMRVSPEKMKVSPEKMRESPEKMREGPEKMSEGPEKMSESPEKMSEGPEKMSKSPEKMSEGPEKMSESPEKMSESPEKMSESPEKMSESPEKMSESPEKMSEGPEKMGEGPEKMRESPEKMRESPEKMRESPEKRRKDPEKMRESPEKRREDPEKMRESPEKRREDPEKIREDPEKMRESLEKMREGPGKRREGPEKKLKGPEKKREGPEKKREDPEKGRDGPEKRRESSEKRRESSEKRREGSEKRREGSEKRREGSEKRREGSEKRREGPEKRREGPEKRREGPEKRREGPEKRREGPEKRRDGPEKRRDGPEKRREGSEKRRGRSEKRRESLEKRRESLEKRRESLEKRRESSEQRRESPEQRRESPEQRRESPEQRRESPEQRRESPEQRRESPEQRRESPEQRRESPSSASKTSRKKRLAAWKELHGLYSEDRKTPCTGAEQIEEKGHIGIALANDQQGAELWHYLKRKDRDPVIGLSSLFECNWDQREPLYLCESCCLKIPERDIVSHVTGFGHRAMYLQGFQHRPAPAGEQQRIRRAAAQYELEKGYGEAQVVDLDPEHYDIMEQDFSPAIKMVKELHAKQNSLLRLLPSSAIPNIQQDVTTMAQDIQMNPSIAELPPQVNPSTTKSQPQATQESENKDPTGTSTDLWSYNDTRTQPVGLNMLTKSRSDASTSCVGHLSPQHRCNYRMEPDLEDSENSEAQPSSTTEAISTTTATTSKTEGTCKATDVTPETNVKMITLSKPGIHIKTDPSYTCLTASRSIEDSAVPYVSKTRATTTCSHPDATSKNAATSNSTATDSKIGTTSKTTAGKPNTATISKPAVIYKTATVSKPAVIYKTATVSKPVVIYKTEVKATTTNSTATTSNSTVATSKSMADTSTTTSNSVATTSNSTGTTSQLMGTTSKLSITTYNSGAMGTTSKLLITTYNSVATTSHSTVTTSQSMGTTSKLSTTTSNSVATTSNSTVTTSQSMGTTSKLSTTSNSVATTSQSIGTNSKLSTTTSNSVATTSQSIGTNSKLSTTTSNSVATTSNSTVTTSQSMGTTSKLSTTTSNSVATTSQSIGTTSKSTAATSNSIASTIRSTATNSQLKATTSKLTATSATSSAPSSNTTSVSATAYQNPEVTIRNGAAPKAISTSATATSNTGASLAAACKTAAASKIKIPTKTHETAFNTTATSKPAVTTMATGKSSTTCENTDGSSKTRRIKNSGGSNADGVPHIHKSGATVSAPSTSTPVGSDKTASAVTSDSSRSKIKTRESEPVVGLNHLVSVQCETNRRLYCRLCSCNVNSYRLHTIDSTHQYLCVKHRFPEWRDGSSETKRDLLEMVTRLAKAEKDEGLTIRTVNVNRATYDKLRKLPEKHALVELKAIMKKNELKQSSTNQEARGPRRQALSTSPREASHPDDVTVRKEPFEDHVNPGDKKGEPEPPRTEVCQPVNCHLEEVALKGDMEGIKSRRISYPPDVNAAHDVSPYTAARTGPVRRKTIEDSATKPAHTPLGSQTQWRPSATQPELHMKQPEVHSEPPDSSNFCPKPSQTSSASARDEHTQAKPTSAVVSIDLSLARPHTHNPQLQDPHLTLGQSKKALSPTSTGEEVEMTPPRLPSCPYSNLKVTVKQEVFESDLEVSAPGCPEEKPHENPDPPATDSDPCPGPPEKRQQRERSDQELQGTQRAMTCPERQSPLVSLEPDLPSPVASLKTVPHNPTGPSKTRAYVLKHSGHSLGHRQSNVSQVLSSTSTIPGKSHLSTYLEVMQVETEPVIGLCSVWECRGISLTAFFLCESCEKTFSTNDICKHMLSTEHRLSYMMKQYSQFLYFWWEPDLPQEFKLDLLKEIAWKLSDREKYNKMDAQVVLLVQDWHERVKAAPFSEALTMLQNIRREQSDIRGPIPTPQQPVAVRKEPFEDYVNPGDEKGEPEPPRTEVCQPVKRHLEEVALKGDTEGIKRRRISYPPDVNAAHDVSPSTAARTGPVRRKTIEDPATKPAHTPLGSQTQWRPSATQPEFHMEQSEVHSEPPDSSNFCPKPSQTSSASARDEHTQAKPTSAVVSIDLSPARPRTHNPQLQDPLPAKCTHGSTQPSPEPAFLPSESTSVTPAVTPPPICSKTKEGPFSDRQMPSIVDRDKLQRIFRLFGESQNDVPPYQASPENAETCSITKSSNHFGENGKWDSECLLMNSAPIPKLQPSSTPLERTFSQEDPVDKVWDYENRQFTPNPNSGLSIDDQSLEGSSGLDNLVFGEDEGSTANPPSTASTHNPNYLQLIGSFAGHDFYIGNRVVLSPPSPASFIATNPTPSQGQLSTGYNVTGCFYNIGSSQFATNPSPICPTNQQFMDGYEELQPTHSYPTVATSNPCDHMSTSSYNTPNYFLNGGDSQFNGNPYVTNRHHSSTDVYPGSGYQFEGHPREPYPSQILPQQGAGQVMGDSHTAPTPPHWVCLHRPPVPQHEQQWYSSTSAAPPAGAGKGTRDSSSFGFGPVGASAKDTHVQGLMTASRNGNNIVIQPQETCPSISNAPDIRCPASANVSYVAANTPPSTPAPSDVEATRFFSERTSIEGYH